MRIGISGAPGGGAASSGASAGASAPLDGGTRASGVPPATAFRALLSPRAHAPGVAAVDGRRPARTGSGAAFATTTRAASGGTSAGVNARPSVHRDADEDARGRKEGHDAPAHAPRAAREKAAHAPSGYGGDASVLDPAMRQLAQMGPSFAAAAALHGQSAPEARARASLEDLLPQLVKRIAWTGDGKKGSVRLELGAGALAGGTVTVHADHGRVRVEVAAPAGADPAEWRRRIGERLEARGLIVEHIDVT
jgi:hypothetical protein